MLDETRLYLSKGNNELYIENCPLHLVEAVRFLYTQYKKENTGVIISDPSRSGKLVLLTLFLKAICQVLKRPVIIFCNDIEIDKWIQCFEQWTDIYNEIETESTNPYIKKSVFIKPTSNIKSMGHHHWGVMVIDDDLLPEKLKVVTKADYKLWITSLDMKKDITNFWSIYKWLNPNKELLKLDDLLAKREEPRIDVINKMILLDTLQQDVVLDCPATKDYLTIPTTQSTKMLPKRTRKNKDTTGRLVKRSKRIYNNDDENISLESKMTNNAIVIDSRLESNIAIPSITTMNIDRQSHLEMSINNGSDRSSHTMGNFVSESKTGSNGDSKKTEQDTDIFTEHVDDNNDNSGILESKSHIGTRKNYDFSDITEHIEATDEIFNEKSKLLLDDVKSKFTLSNEDVIITKTTNKHLNTDIKNELDLELNSRNNVSQDQDDNDDQMDVSNTDINEVNVCNITKTNIDDKLNYLEEKFLNKFKGSILDKLF